MPPSREARSSDDSARATSLHCVRVADVPEPVDAAIQFWRRRRGQAPIYWSRDTWLRQFGSQRSLLRLPDDLSRDHVVAVFADVCTEETARDALLAAMAWGFGPAGYGAWRTRRILEENPAAGRRLLDVYEAVQAEGGPAGFDEMARQPLRYFGVAFGTKYLFYCAHVSPGVDPAPILDAVVRDWFSDRLDIELKVRSWRDAAGYRDYCQYLGSWANARGIEVAELEEAIFEYARHGSAAPRRVAERLDELVLIVERSERLSAEDKSLASDCLERLGELLDEE